MIHRPQKSRQISSMIVGHCRYQDMQRCDKQCTKQTWPLHQQLVPLWCKPEFNQLLMESPARKKIGHRPRRPCPGEVSVVPCLLRLLRHVSGRHNRLSPCRHVADHHAEFTICPVASMSAHAPPRKRPGSHDRAQLCLSMLLLRRP
jgi:hypothetical protein